MPLSITWRACAGLLGLQALAMLVFTTLQYDRFNLTTDFAAYAQAWTAIAHGHLDPYSSVFGLRFWTNDLELMMWLLAPLYWIYPHAVLLVWLQVLAVVGAEWVALAWAREALLKDGGDTARSAWVLGTTAFLLLATPWSWFTIGFDFHFVPFATLFALLAARDIWSGRYRRLLAWVPLALCSEAAAGALCVVAVGLAALLGRPVARKVALVVVAAGCSWVVLARGLGAMRFRGLSLRSMYGYLAAGRTAHFGPAQVVLGLLEQPVRALKMFRSHAGAVTGYLASGGALGLRSCWGLLPAVLVLVPSALNANPDFIRPFSAFQNWPAVVFLAVGSAFVLQHLVGSAGQRRGAVVVICALVVALAAAVAVVYDAAVPGDLTRVSPAAARQLDAVYHQLPAGAELIVSQGVIGRFAAGRTAYPYWARKGGQRFPVDPRRPVVFVLAPRQGTSEGAASQAFAAIRYVQGTLRARRVGQAAGIWSFVWVPGRATTSVVLP